ncbi:MAG: D-alanyl-D-alanine carboxypeptidase family protein [Bacillota bacterium]
MKKGIYLLLIMVFLHTSLTWNYAEPDIDIQGKAALLMDMETGKIIYQKNVEESLPPASITKLMTYLLVMEAVDAEKIKMDDMVPISSQASKISGATYHLKENERISAKELIEVVMIVSANDAAAALAEYEAGNMDTFVENMNERAVEIGLKNSHFVNPTGMPEKQGGNRMSVQDIGVLSRYILAQYGEQLLPLTDQEVYQNPQRNFSKENTNGLLKILPDVDGLKTGYTDEAGYCLVATMKVPAAVENEQDFRLIGVVMGTASNSERIAESKKLLEYGTTHFAKQRVVSKDEVVDQFHLLDWEQLAVDAVAEEDLWVFGPREGLVKKKEVVMNENLLLPILQGDKIGELHITLYDDTLWKVDLRSRTENKVLSFGAYIQRMMQAIVGMFGYLRQAFGSM